MIKAKSIGILKILLERAFALCEKRKPEGFAIELGLYHVQGSKGNWYEVRAGINEQGELFIACTCRGALQEHGCYHAAKAFELHEAEKLKAEKAASQVTSAEMQNSPYLKQGSEKKPEKIGNIRV